MSDWLFALLAFQATPVSPPVLPQTPPLERKQRVAPGDDIVVEGLRDIDDPRSAVTRETLGGGRTGNGARRSRETLQLATRFSDCAVTRELPNMDRLRSALDGVINGADQRFWQSRFVQQKATCAQDTGIALRLGVSTATASTDDVSYYERGAMFISALRLFAPDLKLTKSQTNDPIVQARFNAREIPLARFRLPVDRRYFETAVCFVRLQPELSVRLVRADGADTTARLEAAIVNRGRICVGNARRVYFDPSQFRMYIADAVYRWAVAARGVNSLIPAT